MKNYLKVLALLSILYLGNALAATGPCIFTQNLLEKHGIVKDGIYSAQTLIDLFKKLNVALDQQPFESGQTYQVSSIECDNQSGVGQTTLTVEPVSIVHHSAMNNTIIIPPPSKIIQIKWSVTTQNPIN